MMYRERHGTRLPALGLGTFQLTGTNCRRQVCKGLEIGYRLIDTARAYGNEREVGQGIADSGIPRAEIFVTSKIWREDLSPEAVKREADQSLLEIGTDYLDLLLIHWPNGQFPLEQTLGAMAELQSAGKIRQLGVSNFPSSLFRSACGIAPVFTNQVEYHPLLGQQKVLGVARENGALITAYSPLAQGAVFKEKGLQQLTERHQKQPGQIALRWLLQQEEVLAIPRSSDAGHLADNFDVFDFELSGEEMSAIERLPKDRRCVNPAFAPAWDQ